MSPEQLTVAVLFWGSAVVIGLDALKTEGRKGYALWGVAAVFVAAGFAVRPLWNVFPDLAAFMLDIASFAPTWFFLAGIGYLTWRGRGAVPVAAAQPSADKDLTRETLTSIAGSLDLIDQRIDGVIKTQDKDRERVSKLTEALDQTNNWGKYLEGQIAAERSLTADHVAQQFRNVLLALKAVWHRERLEVREGEISALAIKLARPKTDAAVVQGADWETWEKDELLWRERLDQWCDLASCYTRNVRESVFSTPESRYRKDYGIRDDQFPNSDAVFSFKTFAIIQTNWEGVRDVVTNRVYRAAYGGEANQIVSEAQDD